VQNLGFFEIYGVRTNKGLSQCEHGREGSILCGCLLWTALWNFISTWLYKYWCLYLKNTSFWLFRILASPVRHFGTVPLLRMGRGRTPPNRNLWPLFWV